MFDSSRNKLNFDATNSYNKTTHFSDILLSNGLSRNRFSNMSQSITNTSRNNILNIYTDVSKVYNDSKIIEKNLKNTKKKSNSESYNPYFFKKFERKEIQTQTNDYLTFRRRHVAISNLETDTINKETEYSARLSINKDNLSNLIRSSKKHVTEKLKTTITIPKIHKQPNLSPEMKLKAHRNSNGAEIKLHIESIKQLGRDMLFRQYKRNQRKMDSLKSFHKVYSEKSVKVDLKHLPIIYKREIPRFLNHYFNIKKDKYDFFKTIDNGEQMRKEIRNILYIPGAMIKEKSKLTSLQPKFIKKKFSKFCVETYDVLYNSKMNSLK
jgi:hypothetical protein